MPRAMCLMLASLILSGAAFAQATPTLDLSQAVVVVSDPSRVLATATDMLQDELERRSGVRIEAVNRMPAADTPAIVLGVAGRVPGKATPPSGLAVPEKAEAYALWADAAGRAAPTVYLVGRDERGALFAVGRLIRFLRFDVKRIDLPADTRVATAPVATLRGHQLGYRETANTYDMWDLDMYEQYLRDLIIFGTNSVELITSLDPTYKEGNATYETQWDMNVKLTGLLDRYGIDCWFWMPLEGDVRDPKVAEKELDERAKFFAACADIDHVMVPGGDPGRTKPADLYPWLARLADVLHARFPNAGLWVSNQKFKGEEVDEFWRYLREQHPEWLRGIVYGPSSPGDVRYNREQLPKEYMLRLYPDITHSVRCQYGVPDFHVLLSQTLDREACNPRPEGMRAIHNRWVNDCDGFVSYSDGAHDDVNKMLFSSLGWDPNADLDALLTDYGRVFFGENVAADVAKGLRGLEANWEGDPRENEGIERTLAIWRAIGRKGGNALAGNWRYQLHLFRALFDAQVRERGIVEAGYEREALAALARVPQVGVPQALADARAALAKADTDDAGQGLRRELFDLGPKLHKSIGFQLSIEPPYFARNPERGALLDKVDRPLNDRPWLETEFRHVESLVETDEQLALIDRILHWDDAGPGGFYDDLGDAKRQPHLLDRLPYAEDPDNLHSVRTGFYRSQDHLTRAYAPLKLSWIDYAEPPEGDPVRMEYDGLDPSAQYRVRVTYFGRYFAMTRLVADGQYEIHSGLWPNESKVWPIEFAVPQEATRDGQLLLEWQLAEGRGVQIAEVWLIKQTP